eukprot:CAMPEP_0196659062 /NCGR_PEP_ID=MMETSP1086-20130531/32939_1 /TAXON_ID=77921 /ORGANISM="Cyanoptyche  gloeocystis , Strain SAG4.97" /LENGTH=50 /DNA_ID=CAMNT_0041992895 /DNA_START=57 /DNA_END=206 /DNA_ORIENTATION=+
MSMEVSEAASDDCQRKRKGEAEETKREERTGKETGAGPVQGAEWRQRQSR